MKESIVNSIFQINGLIQDCKEITYETIANKYIEIKNNFKSINALINNEKESIIVEPYKMQTENANFFIDNEFIGYIVENEFKLDFLFENDDLKRPKIVGKIINKNRPKKFLINSYSEIGHSCGRIGRLMEVLINNISLSTDIVFEGNLNALKIIINSYNDEYIISTQYYENEEKSELVNINGIVFQKPSSCIFKIKEKSLKIISSKQENSIMTYNYEYYSKYLNL